MAFGHLIPAGIFRSILCFPNPSAKFRIVLCLKCQIQSLKQNVCEQKEKMWADATGDVLQKLTWSDLELSQLKCVWVPSAQLSECLLENKKKLGIAQFLFFFQSLRLPSRNI